ncbi:right-handed parallel beta-helix repeat-containing protein [Candidatus Saccharibacteria bacterium]|nr:right-handed parallel beta-helix repeat-containing protein [Candidatus Saccharibacteria bacterium]
MKKILQKLSTKQVIFISAFAVVGVGLLINSFAATGFLSIEPEMATNISGCAQPVSDNSASDGEYVQFGNGANCGLDHSGKTIPAHNYPVPSDAIFISPAGSDKTSNSPDGNDSNSGTSVNTPVKSISRAISLVSSTGRKTIVMRGGEYRDWHTKGGGKDKSVYYESTSFTLQAYQDESPWFNGADIVSGWKSDGNNRWRLDDWNTPDFCTAGKYYNSIEDGKPPFYPTWNPDVTVRSICGYADSFRNNTNVAGDPQNVFINDTKLDQVPTLAQVSTNSFFYDWYNKKMYIGQDPTGKKVELSRRTQALMLNKGEDGGQYAIKGIGFKRYASGGWDGSWDQNWTIAGTVFVNEPKKPMLVENSVFVDNSAIGLSFSQPRNVKITNSVFAYNGYSGLHANGSRTAADGGRDDLIVEGNVFNGNNDENNDTKCSQACGAANVKLNNMVGTTIRNNIANNAPAEAPGLWCDVHCSDVNIVNNVTQNNGGNGIFYEISRDGVIANNLVVDNGTDNISVTSARVKIYNNTVIFNRPQGSIARGIEVFDDDRCAVCWNDPGIGPDTKNIELVNNIVVAKSNAELSVNVDNREAVGKYATPTTTTNTKTSEFYDKFDYNAYHRTSSDNELYVWRYDNGTTDYHIKSTASFTSKTGWDSHSLDLSGSSDPFFVDINNGDYRVRQNSQAYNTGQPLPSDVAQLIGAQAGQPISRGAISWPSF